MKKERTYTKTITTEEFYCDVCGKKLTKQESKCWPPYATLHYNKFYNGKLEEEHADLNITLDLCKECNEEVVDFVYNEYCQFRRKVDNENLIKLFKEK